MKNGRRVTVWMILAALAAASSLWAEIETKPEYPAKVHLKRTEPRAVATMRHRGPFEEVPAVIMELVRQVESGGHHIAGPIMGIYYSDPREVPEEDLLWEIWVPVVYPGPIGQVENDEMGFTYVDPVFVAYTYHVGPYETTGETYETLIEWAVRNDYKIAGPPIDVYWSDPTEVPEEGLVTEIWFPVEEKKIPGGVVK